MVGYESVVVGYSMRFVLIAMFGLFAAASSGPVAMLPGMILGLVVSVMGKI